MRFSIRFTVEEGAIGHVLAALNSHDGVVFDNLDILPLTPSRPDRKPKGSKALTAREIILQLLAAEGPQSFERIKVVLVSRGFAGGGVGSLINNRMSRAYGEIESLAPGVWSLVKPKED
jgi:hypothetical protein